MKTANIFDSIPESMPDEVFQDIIKSSGFRLERIISRGHSTEPGKWYDQEEDEWVMLISGEAELLFEEGYEKIRMKPGDYLLIPAHKRHRVEWTAKDQDTVWLALHFRQ